MSLCRLLCAARDSSSRFCYASYKLIYIGRPPCGDTFLIPETSPDSSCLFDIHRLMRADTGRHDTL